MTILKTAALAIALAAAGLFAFVSVAPGTAARMAFEWERSRAGLEARQIELPDGTRIAYLDGGVGETMLLIHGFGGEKDHFTRVAGYLTPHYRVVAPDVPGFGESSKTPGVSYSPAVQADRLRALIQALGVDKVHVGGNSMGGAIAAMYAVQYPDEVESLWLLAPAGVWSAPHADIVPRLDEDGEHLLIPENEEDFVRLLEFATSDPPYIPGFMVTEMARRRLADNALEPAIFEEVGSFSIEERVDGLRTPTLIVWGDEDRALHVDSAQILHERMPASQVVIMPGIGHAPMIERPAESAAAYLQFLAG